jgi:hypothetical protein
VLASAAGEGRRRKGKFQVKFFGVGSRVPRAALRNVIAASMLSVGVVALASGVAFAAPTSFTWSGAGGDQVWSDGANWAGGTAPQPHTSVDLTLPILSCGSNCGQSQNDVTGLKAANISLALGVETGNGDYNIQGNGIKVGTIDVTSNTSNGQNEQGAFLGVPMTLAASESWSVDTENNSNLDFSTVGGASTDSLTVSLPPGTAGNFGGFINFPSINTGPLTFQGLGGMSSITGANFNGTSQEPVKFAHAGLFVIGPGGTTKKTTTTDYGPLTVKGSTIQFGNGGGTGPYGINSVEGNASFDSATTISLDSLEPGTGAKPIAGVDYPQIAATGTVKLGSANLPLIAACNQALGTKYTIVTGSAINGTFSGLSNGTVAQAVSDGSPSCQQAGATSPWFQIQYSATAVTVTVVAAPPADSAHAPASGLAPVAHVESGGALSFEG